MYSNELKKRLARLNRGGLKLPSAPPPAAPDVEPDSARTIFVPALSGDGARRGPLPLAEAAPGRVVEIEDGGTFWLIERRLHELAPQCGQFLARYRDLLASEALLLPKGVHGHLAEFAESDPGRVLYLDIETTGLSGRPLFLIGTMQLDGQDFVLRQYFARHYAEERHLLAAFARALPCFEMLVTFNGRTFDLPYMRDRATVNRLSLELPARHLDLLQESRRRWKRIFPNCKLTTLEERVCGRRRVDDVPGAQIPAVYHDYVHTEDASLIRHVIHHNALDILTMAELALVMLTGEKDWD